MSLPLDNDVWHRVMKSKKIKSGKKKMRNIGLRSIMILRNDDGIHATDALCRHMAWPLSYGGKIKDGCITCPLHQTRYDLDNGEIKEWSPFPLFPMYGKLLGKMRRPSSLAIHTARELDGWVEVKLSN